MAIRKIPQRKCVGCGTSKDKKELIRVVKNAEGEISVDLTGKKNGRGAYICHSVKCLNSAVKAKRLERAFEISSISALNPIQSITFSKRFPILLQPQSSPRPCSHSHPCRNNRHGQNVF